MKPTRRAVIVAAAMFLAACAPEVVRLPADLAASTASSRRYETTQTANFSLTSGYSRTIASGTQLIDIGMVAQGRVLRPTNTVFSVEGAHVHEAYLVIDGPKLVGFYLPFERAFVSLASPFDLKLKEIGQ
jgi:hypothetical protein